MKSILFLIFFNVFIYAQNLKNDMGFNIFTLNSKLTKSGKYILDNRNLDNKSFVFKYTFKNNSNFKPFIIGGFGFSDFDSNNSSFNSTFIKAGAGVNYRFTKSLNLNIGFSKLRLNSDINGIYKEIYSNKSKNSINDFYIDLNHKKFINKKRILKSNLTIHKQNILYDFNLGSLSGFNITSDFALININSNKIFNLDISTKAYIETSYLDKKLSNVTGYNYAGALGANLYINIGKYIPILKEKSKNLNLDFSAKIIKGNNNFTGYKIGAGLKLLKF